MKLYVKVFKTKNDKRAVALCFGKHILTFDEKVILEALDMRPSELDDLDYGDYPIV